MLNCALPSDTCWGCSVISNSKRFGTRVKKAREARGMNVSELAHLTHVTPAAVWNWENKNRVPRTKTLSTLAATLGVSKEWLITGNDGVSAHKQGPIDLSRCSLEELIHAIAQRGFKVSVAPESP